MDVFIIILHTAIINQLNLIISLAYIIKLYLLLVSCVNLEILRNLTVSIVIIYYIIDALENVLLTLVVGFEHEEHHV